MRQRLATGRQAWGMTRVCTAPRNRVWHTCVRFRPRSKNHVLPSRVQGRVLHGSMHPASLCACVYKAHAARTGGAVFTCSRFFYAGQGRPLPQKKGVFCSCRWVPKPLARVKNKWEIGPSRQCGRRKRGDQQAAVCGLLRRALAVSGFDKCGGRKGRTPAFGSHDLLLEEGTESVMYFLRDRLYVLVYFLRASRRICVLNEAGREMMSEKWWVRSMCEIRWCS